MVGVELVSEFVSILHLGEAAELPVGFALNPIFLGVSHHSGAL